jgi:hypothetical protein
MYSCIPYEAVYLGKDSRLQPTNRDCGKEIDYTDQGVSGRFSWYVHNCTMGTILSPPLEEFDIYLNYVWKLGFEETPDYNFLCELFTKVLKNNNYQSLNVI